jgi:hypothetical protein
MYSNQQMSYALQTSDGNVSISSIDKKYFKLAVGLERIGKQSDVDISARCPVCGDSSTKKGSKRLHMYNKNNSTGVNCFNGDCAVHNKTTYSFLRDFYPALLDQYKKETFSTTLEKLSSGVAEDVFAGFKKEEPLDFLENKKSLKAPDGSDGSDVLVEEKPEVLVQDLSMFFTDINEVPEAIAYIESRGMEYKESYGKWYYGHQDLKIGDITYQTSNSIVIPLYYKNQMYAFYSRSIEGKNFATYMNEHNIGYKIWNWFDVNKEEPVYIYEGIFDAIAGGFKNSIALMGAKLPDDRLKELKKPVFVLDDDITGIKNSINYSKLGHTVYVQPNGYEKDMNANLLLGYNTSGLITSNLYAGLSAEIRLKNKL